MSDPTLKSDKSEEVKSADHHKLSHEERKAERKFAKLREAWKHIAITEDAPKSEKEIEKGMHDFAKIYLDWNSKHGKVSAEDAHVKVKQIQTNNSVLHLS